jgi:hypothetical protein
MRTFCSNKEKFSFIPNQTNSSKKKEKNVTYFYNESPHFAQNRHNLESTSAKMIIIMWCISSSFLKKREKQHLSFNKKNSMNIFTLNTSV